MNNTEFLNELEQAKQLARSGELDIALQIFEKLYAADNNEQNLSLIYYMQNSLKQAANYSKAIEIGLVACELPEVWDSIRHNTAWYRDWETDRKSTRLNSSHITRSRMPSSA